MSLTKVTYSMINGAVANVLDYGAVADGVTDDLAAFNAAAATGKTVYIPAGSYLVSAPTSSAFWYIENGATIVGLPDIDPGPGGGDLNDTSRLTGKVFAIVNFPSETGIRIGDSDPWLEKSIRPFTETISELVVLSEAGQIGVLGASRTSDDITANFACIGVSGYGINDNTTNPEPSWASYFEGRREAGTGAAYCSEMDMLNTGATYDLTPYSTISTTTEQSVNLWLSSGGGDVALGGNPNSAAMTILPNPATYKRGIVFRNGSLDGTTNEAITMPVGYEVAWYNTDNQLNSYTTHRTIYQKTITDDASGSQWDSVKWRGGGAASQALDEIHRHRFYGSSGSSTDYLGALHQCFQRTNFVGSNARFSYDISAKNSDGSLAVVTLNAAQDNSYTPGTDDSISLGIAAARWSVVYAATGAINTSDANEKQDIAKLDDAEKRVAVVIKGLIKKFRFKSAVEKKGDDARIHVGVIAQDVKAAFEAEGLDASRYGMFCSDTWVDDDGVEHTRLGVRYEELLAFVIAAS